MESTLEASQECSTRNDRVVGTCIHYIEQVGNGRRQDFIDQLAQEGRLD